MLVVLSLIVFIVIMLSFRRGRGIVFFDIDDTLTTMTESDREIVIQHCLDKNYDVGIITASDRPIEHVVNPDGTANVEISPWMPEKLARYLYDTDFQTYNSWSLTTGLNCPFPRFKLDNRIFGWKKGWQMEMSINEFGYDRSKCFLFDDQKLVLDSAKDVCKGVNYILVDNNKLTKRLNIGLVKRLIK